MLAQGNRRSYGDACLFRRVVSTLELGNLLNFDPDCGILRCEAGVTLDGIIRFALPRGWFPPVTPGTKFLTLGGCIAADVHGKNHHVDGTIGNFVDELEMILASGERVRCSRTSSSELFWATLGGMGLTGFIYAVTLRLRSVASAHLNVFSIKTQRLEETLRIFGETQEEYTYSVAWIDCLSQGDRLGRGLVFLGNHADAKPGSDAFPLHPERLREIPIHLPEFFLSSRNMRAFNSLYYHRQLRRRRKSRQHYDPFFYPLDTIGHWNKIYGRRGFLQYQFAVPFKNGLDVLREILTRIASSRSGSFLAVLKAFGQQEGILSFPIPGYTLSLDFPMRDGQILNLLQELNDLVREAGGRVYLAKDAMLRQQDFEIMYPGVSEFKRIKQFYDPGGKFRSHQSDRLGLT